MSVTQQIRWIYFEAFITETYVQLVATKAVCYSTSWSALITGLLMKPE